MLYKHEGQIYDYSPLQIEQGFAKGEPLTDEEIENFNKPKEPTAQDKANEAQVFLDSTDYAIIKCMENGLNIDDDYPELREKREDARKVVRQSKENSQTSKDI